MCGLIATITKDTYCTRLDDWFKDALMASQLRGLHSTGMFQVTQTKQIANFKKAVTASDFIGMNEARSLISAVPRSPITVGHVRHATQGVIKDENAHPFVFVRDSDKTKVAGVHNGTLTGWRGKEGGDKQDVDSAWAFHKFATEGPIDAFEYFNGAFAFIWYDSRYPDHLWTARNDQRPLHYFHSKDKKTLMFASELGMLGWVTERNRFENDGTQMFYTEPNKIYKFSIVNPGEVEYFDMPKYDPTTTIVLPPVHRPATNMTPYHRHHGMMMGGDDDLPFGRPATPNTRSFGNRGSSTVNYNSTRFNDQEYVLGKAKAALKRARDAIWDEAQGHKAVVTTEDLDENLEKGIKKAIAKHQAERFDVWALAGDHFRIADPNDRNATPMEIQRARDMGMFGVAAAYSGVLYDDDTSENLGEAYIKTNEKGSLCEARDCLLRGLSKAAAEAKFNKLNEAIPVVIIGATDGINKGEVTFIVAELSDAQRINLQQRIEGVKNVVAGLH